MTNKQEEEEEWDLKYYKVIFIKLKHYYIIFPFLLDIIKERERENKQKA